VNEIGWLGLGSLAIFFTVAASTKASRVFYSASLAINLLHHRGEREGVGISIRLKLTKYEIENLDG
jgi:hypothetical protein